MKRNPSSFSIILIFVCLSIIGASLIPLLSVQLIPSKKSPTLSVSFSWRDASSKVLEQEVTSKLEGVFNTIKGVKKISSYSNKGRGSISINFKKNIDIDVVRFEIANLIRQSYSELPEGVSYPQLSLSSANENNAPIISYSVNANESPYHIKKYAENYIVPKLSNIKGINQINVYGAAPFEWVIEYDSQKLIQLNITVNDINSAINEYLQTKALGNGIITSKYSETIQEIAVVLKHKLEDDAIIWKEIPIKKNNKIIYLKNLAKVRFKEGAMRNFYRVNGLNTVNLVVSAEKDVNTIALVKEVRNLVEVIKKDIPIGYSIKLTQDTTDYIVEELRKIGLRTFFSFLILLVLIILINRSFKYLAVLFLSIITNLLIAVVFYYLFKVELQLYSFAGITISFGIIIDNSIIMIDHLRNKGDKKVFLAILAATLTTIGALMVVFLLEESQRNNLWDFALVIAINIGVSLLISLYYVPALLEKINLEHKRVKFSRKRKRRVYKFTRKYTNIITWMRKPKFKWIFIILVVLGFGLPLHLLPKFIEGEGHLASTYNKILGNEWFNTEMRPTLETILGGSLRLFTEDVFKNSYYNEPERTTLRITGSMPDGCTIEQLNDVIIKMENYIGLFEEVELYETRINSHKSSSISIYFKDEFERGSFPHTLKSLLESKVNSLGGLDWSVSGVGRGFSNALGTGYKSNIIEIEGYNYDKLYGYAEFLKKQLIKNSFGRIKDVEISGSRRGNNVLNEYYLDFDIEKLAIADVSQTQVYSYLKNQVYTGILTSIVQDNELQQVKLVSDNYKKFNVWDLKHTPISIQNKQYKLDQLAAIEKRKTGNSISKTNQQYRLIVSYNFIGSYQLANKVKENNIEKLKNKLPMGYRTFNQLFNRWNKEDSKQYFYILIVIVIVFFICSILLESLKQPLAIISMIPISFIGVFLTFYLFEFNFDQGGYAAFILLCGISVNSALYIINDYNNLRKQHQKRNIQSLFFKAFNYKIIPVTLTIISTIVGLVPFVWNGQNEAFWFSFAVGSIGGLIFSLIGIFFYLPIFIVRNKK
ncbi:efflux RND transporter permease subunit [Flavivirga aquimarina]|nr:efflux RND transporter permease subunit [Flavivirga aquimarina]